MSSLNAIKLACILAVAFSTATQVSARGSRAVKPVKDDRKFSGPSKTVVETIATDPHFAALTLALVETGLLPTVEGLPEPFTVMAPLNQAFCRLGNRVLNIAGCSDEDACPPACWAEVVNATKDNLLPNILASHVVLEELSLRDLKKAQLPRNRITTIGTYVPNGESFYFETEVFKNGDESVLCKVLAVFNCFPLYTPPPSAVLGYVKAALKATNGVVWPIDSILDPVSEVV